MQNILILTASFGMGHKSVSNAIKEQIELKNNNLNIEIVDILDILNPTLKDVGSKIYYNLTEHYPIVYNTIYDIKKSNKNNIFDSLLSNTYYKKLYSYIKLTSPNLIISTFPLCSCVVSKVKKEYGIKIKLVTVITDIVDSWEWLYEGTNMYFVPSKEIKDKLIDKGIDENIIEVTGIPVKNSFLNNNNNNVNKNTLLIIATGMTENDLPHNMLKQLDSYDTLKTVIVTGRNKELYNKLSKKTYKNITILGFVNNIDKLMDEAIFLVTKPGGITVFEAINKELPLVIKDTKIGQEKGNIEFIKRNNLGMVINDNNDLLKIVNDYIKNPYKTYKICKNISEVKRNLKPYRVAECILDNVNYS